MEYNILELQVVQAARQIKDKENVFVGVGLPNLVINLAKRLYVPHINMIYEAGVIGANPRRLPLSIGDPTLVSGAEGVVSMFELFNFYLSGGLIDVGFLAGAQVDKFGNINTTVIGDYNNPKVRLPGSGGANAISCLAKRIFILNTHTQRNFPESVDFITSPGFINGRKKRESLGFSGGPEIVVTNLGILKFDENGEMYLDSIHPGVSIDDVKNNTGWNLKISENLKVTEPPNGDDLRIIREELDPLGMYTRKGESKK